MAHQKFMNTTAGNNESGFAILEGMIATAVFAIIAAAVALMLTGSFKADNNARRLTELSASAADKVESLFPLDYLNDSELSDGAKPPVSSGDYSISYNIAQDTILKNTKHIRVTVQWLPQNGAPKTVTFDHIKPDTI